MAIFVVVLPLALVAISLAGEVSLLYDRLGSGNLDPGHYLRGVFARLPDWMTTLLDRFGLVNFEVLQRRLTAMVSQGSQFIAERAFSLGQNTFDFVASLCITVYLAFFMIRDGDGMVRDLRQAIPLTPGHTQQLLDKFTAVIRGTVRGNLLVAVLQGALGGLSFWFLGVGGALLWGVLMAFLSLLPAVGAALVWGPVAIYLLVTGAVWQGCALIAFGTLVIGLVDNLLRPLLVGKDTQMPDYLVMITTLGGMAVFGINGFIVGPAIASMFLAVWHIFVSVRGDARS